MGIINVLDFSVANLIAAGEVVERPSSAVKELLENSIDAGAKKITVEIQKGGVAFIRVCDDGKGMSREDVPIAVKRHATSKIKDESDLDGIITLGFRGEALAAISSVSKLRIMTKTKDEKTGTLLTSEAGKNVTVSEAVCQVGTTVIIEELFYNVPARRKFLKKDATEALAVCAVVEKIALSHPEIAIRFISDGSVRIDTQGDGKLINTIYSVFGREFTKKLSKVDYMSEGAEIYGYIGNPDNIRPNRNYENFFINSRYVKSKTASAALEQAFESYIPQDKFPVCILNINLHPTFVDVNVHPAKLEVKFSDERPVFHAVYSAVRGVLEAGVDRPVLMTEKIPEKTKAEQGNRLINSFVPLKDMTEKNETVQTSFDNIGSENIQPKKYEKTEPKNEIGFSEPVYSGGFTSFKVPDIEFSPLFDSKEEVTLPEKTPEIIQKTEPEVTEKKPEPEKKVLPFYRIIGEAFFSYVFVETDECVLIIDKHAAHERLIFERLKANLHNAAPVSQLLLIPMIVDLSSEEMSAVEQYGKEIEKTGFDYTLQKTSKTATVYSVPVGLEEGAARDMFILIAGRLGEGTGDAVQTREMIYEKALYQASCKAAIKAGSEHAEEDIKALVEELLLLPDIKYCPHGRPVAIEMSKNDFDRQFKRK